MDNTEQLDVQEWTISSQEIEIQMKNVFVNAFSASYRKIAEGQDVKSVFGITDELDDFLDAAYDSVFAKVKQNPDIYTVYICGNSQNSVVGIAIFCSDSMGDEEVILDQLAVDPNFWHRGIAKHLIFQILSKRKSTQKIHLMSRRINHQAIRLYQKLGFKESDFKYGHYNLSQFVGYTLDVKLLEAQTQNSNC
mmetsp:Transcript_3350/g.4600  ORF Transcript_3350/g.4600 Transcript_3350/m.4600 type:complete len:193 (+) Transcript_3350:53-631(+)